MEYKYDVFISHSSQDTPAVRELVQRLQSDGIKAWFYENDISPDLIADKINAAIAYSGAFLLIMSPSAFQSRWVNLEWNTALNRDMEKNEKRLLTLLLETTEITGILKSYPYTDWRNRDESEYQKLVNRIKAISLPQEDKREAPSSPIQTRWYKSIWWHISVVASALALAIFLLIFSRSKPTNDKTDDQSTALKSHKSVTVVVGSFKDADGQTFANSLFYSLDGHVNESVGIDFDNSAKDSTVTGKYTSPFRGILVTGYANKSANAYGATIDQINMQDTLQTNYKGRHLTINNPARMKLDLPDKAAFLGEFVKCLCEYNMGDYKESKECFRMLYDSTTEKGDLKFYTSLFTLNSSLILHDSITINTFLLNTEKIAQITGHKESLYFETKLYDTLSKDSPVNKVKNAKDEFTSPNLSFRKVDDGHKQDIFLRTDSIPHSELIPKVTGMTLKIFTYLVTNNDTILIRNVNNVAIETKLKKSNDIMASDEKYIIIPKITDQRNMYLTYVKDKQHWNTYLIDTGRQTEIISSSIFVLKASVDHTSQATWKAGYFNLALWVERGKKNSPQ